MKIIISVTRKKYNKKVKCVLIKRVLYYIYLFKIYMCLLKIKVYLIIINLLLIFAPLTFLQALASVLVCIRLDARLHRKYGFVLSVNIYFH